MSRSVTLILAVDPVVPVIVWTSWIYFMAGLLVVTEVFIAVLPGTVNGI